MFEIPIRFGEGDLPHLYTNDGMPFKVHAVFDISLVATPEALEVSTFGFRASSRREERLTSEAFKRALTNPLKGVISDAVQKLNYLPALTATSEPAQNVS